MEQYVKEWPTVSPWATQWVSIKPGRRRPLFVLFSHIKRKEKRKEKMNFKNQKTPAKRGSFWPSQKSVWPRWLSLSLFHTHSWDSWVMTKSTSSPNAHYTQTQRCFFRHHLFFFILAAKLKTSPTKFTSNLISFFFSVILY